MHDFLKKKSTQVIVWIVSALFAAYCIQGFIAMARQQNVGYLVRDMGFAADQLNKSQPGIKRAETFIARLKKMDTSSVPDDIKLAFQDYVSTFQQSVDALKAGRDTTILDADILKAQRKLAFCVKKYE
jgi:hypothetical protein